MDDANHVPASLDVRVTRHISLPPCLVSLSSRLPGSVCSGYTCSCTCTCARGKTRTKRSTMGNRFASRLTPLPRASPQPGSRPGVYVSLARDWRADLVAGFALRCFQRFSLPDDGYPAPASGETTGTPAVRSHGSSRTTRNSTQLSHAHTG